MKTSYSCCSRVPLLLLVALALCLGAAARAQVSDPSEVKSKPKPEGRRTITFTDRNGHRYEDVEVVTIEPDGIAYLEADRVHAGKVKFTDMTESDRTRLGYDPDRAVRHAQQQAEQERSRLAAAQRASAERQLAAAKHALQGGSEDSSPRDHQTYYGTGFFVADDGCILTCAHVTEGATRITVKCQQGVFPATLVKSDPDNDLALLKVSGSFRALPVAQAGGAKLGDSVFTIGFPNIRLQGFEPKLTRGEISSLAGLQDDPRHFQISVAVQPGNSGGALVNSAGSVVGVVAMRLSELAALKTSGMLPQNVNYALKCDAVTAFLGALPEVSARLKKPSGAGDRKSEEIVKEVEDATALVIATLPGLAQ